MLSFLLLAVFGTATLSLLFVWRLKQDAEYETRRRRERWWDF